MTLIAYHGFENGLHPVFVSDILVSSTRPGASTVELPTFEQCDDGRVERAVALRQKVAILNGEVVVAVAGTMFQGSMFARELSEELPGYLAAKQNKIGHVLDKVLQNEAFHREVSDISVLVSHVSTDGQTRRASHCASSIYDSTPPRNYDSRVLGQVLAYGSGSETYVDFVSRVQFQQIPRPPASKFFREVALAFIPLARFIAAESKSKQGHLREFWGGGFEVTAFYERQFRKLDNLMYVLSDIDVDVSSAEILPFRFIKLRYVREHLFIRSVAIRRREVTSRRVPS